MTNNIYLCMLQVLDDPTGVRIIVNTNYPQFGVKLNGDDCVDNAYFMIDRSDGGGVQKVDADGKPMFNEDGTIVWEESEVYDYWWVTDSIGQGHRFNSNVELIEFLDSIEDLIVDAYVESF